MTTKKVYRFLHGNEIIQEGDYFSAVGNNPTLDQVETNNSMWWKITADNSGNVYIGKKLNETVGGVKIARFHTVVCEHCGK